MKKLNSLYNAVNDLQNPGIQNLNLIVHFRAGILHN